MRSAAKRARRAPLHGSTRLAWPGWLSTPRQDTTQARRMSPRAPGCAAAPTVTVWLGGLLPPAVAVNVRVVGETVNVAGRVPPLSEYAPTVPLSVELNPSQLPTKRRPFAIIGAAKVWPSAEALCHNGV